MIIIVTELKRLEKYAEKNNIPIMEKSSLKFLLNYIKNNNVKTILEIGTAIGYSAINMALVSDKLSITTIEKDENRYLEALKNIKKFNLEKRITLILGNALDLKIDEKFDLIFIDAAKGQYIEYFEKYKNNLKENGTIIADNVYFKGLVEQKDKIEKKSLQQLIEKIKKYIIYLKNNKEFETTFYKIGDGISVSKRRK